MLFCVCYFTYLGTCGRNECAISAYNDNLHNGTCQRESLSIIMLSIMLSKLVSYMYMHELMCISGQMHLSGLHGLCVTS